MIRRTPQPIGRRGRAAFPPRRSGGRRLCFWRRAVGVPADPFTFRSRHTVLARTLVSPRSITLAAPRVELILAPRVEVARGAPATLSAGTAEASAEIRARESLVLRERLDRVATRALRLERRVEREVRNWQPLPLAARESHLTPSAAAQPASTQKLVFRADKPVVVEPPRAQVATAPAALEAAGPPARIATAALADEVLRVLDRRIVAERERRGHV